MTDASAVCTNMGKSTLIPMNIPIALVPVPGAAITVDVTPQLVRVVKDAPPIEKHTGRWSREEHEIFLKALDKYGREWKKMSTMIKTRTVIQIRTHAQKYFQKLQKNPKMAEASKHANHLRKRTAMVLQRPPKKKKCLKLKKTTPACNHPTKESLSTSPTSTVSFDFTPEFSLTESAAANLFPGVFSRCLGSPISSPVDDIFMDPVDPNWDQFVL